MNLQLSEIQSLESSIKELQHDYKILNNMANLVGLPTNDVMKQNESVAAFHAYVRDTTLTAVADGSAIPYFDVFNEYQFHITYCSSIYQSVPFSILCLKMVFLTLIFGLLRLRFNYLKIKRNIKVI